MQYSEQGIVTATHNVNGISLTSATALVKLDATHIAIYAADCSDEGALLLLFDLKFGMTVATRRLKVFSNPPVLYCSSSNRVLLLCVVQNLVVVPYILQPSLLWNLIGQNGHASESKCQPLVVSWSSKQVAPDAAAAALEKQRPKNPLKFRKAEINQLADSLWQSDASFCRLFDELLPLLKEDNDVQGVCLLLSHVKDLPEKWQADLLNFFLRHSSEHVDEQESQRLALLLSIPYSDVVLLSHLRKTLTTKSTLKLLRYLAALLQERQWLQENGGGGGGEKTPEIDQIVDWISLILDAHHNELLIAGADVHVQQLVQQLSRLVAERYDFLDCLGQSEALIQLLQKKKKPPANRRKDWYAIEVVRLL